MEGSGLKDIMTVMGGIGLLIFAFLVLNNAGAFSQITNSIAGASSTTIAVLQGRGGGFGASRLGGTAGLTAYA